VVGRFELSDATLTFRSLSFHSGFRTFEALLAQQGPWVAGLDFPFGLPAKFIANVGWNPSWPVYVAHVGRMDRGEFCKLLDDYKRPRAKGDKEHLRATDRLAGSVSPQKQYGVPVAKMFFEGAPRLLASGAAVPGLIDGDPHRIAFEAYPGVLARSLVGRSSYKNDDRRKQSERQREARHAILAAITGGKHTAKFGFEVRAPMELIDDPTGDTLDSLLCAMQAGWAWRNCDRRFGMPDDLGPTEGWIAHPGL